MDEGVERKLERIGAAEMGFDEFDGGNLFGAEEFGDFGDGWLNGE